MPKRLLLTGIGGFIGSHTLAHFMHHTDWDLIGLDSFRHKGKTDRITQILEANPEWRSRLRVITHDLVAPLSPQLQDRIGPLDYIISMASESSVDRSISDPVPFITNNVNVALNMLEYARAVRPSMYIQISCYDKQTRAVTKDGLKSYSELKLGDVVYTLNPITKKLEEQPVEKVIIQDYNGKMVYGKTKQIDFLVTPNHRMFNREMEVIEAKEFLNGSSYLGFQFPFSTGYIGESTPIAIGNRIYTDKEDLKQLFYLIGIYLGDGFTAKQDKVMKSASGLTKVERDKNKQCRNSLGQYISTNSPIGVKEYNHFTSWRIFFDIPILDKARIRTEYALASLGIKYTCQKGKAGEHLYFTSKDWVEFFDQFGKGVHNKFIPSWVLKYDSQFLTELFLGLIDSDGHWHGRSPSFCTVSDGLAKGMCEVAVKIGYLPTIRKRTTEAFFKKENRYIRGEAYFFTFSKERKSIKHQRIRDIKYKDKVWCITVKNKNFLVERNGVFYYAGNTDETAGPAKLGQYHKEWATPLPSNPYSSSKLCQEAISFSYWRTYGVPVVCTRTMNNVGEMQDPEKYVPMLIAKINAGEPVTIHGRSPSDCGSRFYLHARNHADALLFILTHTPPIAYKEDIVDRHPMYNVVGEVEMNNYDLAAIIADIIGKPLNYKFVDFHAARPGHDRRYALDGALLKSLGWVPPVPFYESLKKTVEWTLAHPEWLK